MVPEPALGHRLQYGWASRGLEGVNRQQWIAISSHLSTRRRWLDDQVLSWLLYDDAAPPLAIGCAEIGDYGLVYLRTDSGDRDSAGRPGAYVTEGALFEGGLPVGHLGNVLPALADRRQGWHRGSEPLPDLVVEPASGRRPARADQREQTALAIGCLVEERRPNLTAATLEEGWTLLCLLIEVLGRDLVPAGVGEGPPLASRMVLNVGIEPTKPAEVAPDWRAAADLLLARRTDLLADALVTHLQGTAPHRRSFLSRLVSWTRIEAEAQASGALTEEHARFVLREPERLELLAERGHWRVALGLAPVSKRPSLLRAIAPPEQPIAARTLLSDLPLTEQLAHLPSLGLDRQASAELRDRVLMGATRAAVVHLPLTRQAELLSEEPPIPEEISSAILSNDPRVLLRVRDQRRVRDLVAALPDELPPEFWSRLLSNPDRSPDLVAAVLRGPHAAERIATAIQDAHQQEDPGLLLAVVTATADLPASTRREAIERWAFLRPSASLEQVAAVIDAVVISGLPVPEALDRLNIDRFSAALASTAPSAPLPAATIPVVASLCRLSVNSPDDRRRLAALRAYFRVADPSTDPRTRRYAVKALQEADPPLSDALMMRIDNLAGAQGLRRMPEGPRSPHKRRLRISRSRVGAPVSPQATDNSSSGDQSSASWWWRAVRMMRGSRR